MKKIILLTLTAVLTIPFIASAQKTTVTRVNREKAYRTVQTEYTVPSDPTPAPPAPTVATPRKKLTWYQGEIDLGIAIGGGMTGPILETIHGIHISKYAFVGAGLGIHYPIDYGDPLIPLFADFKFYYPLNETIAPFLNIDAGYEVCEGGVYFSAGLGLKYKRWSFSAGVRGNATDNYGVSYGSYSYEVSETSFYGFLKVGFTF